MKVVKGHLEHIPTLEWPDSSELVVKNGASLKVTDKDGKETIYEIKCPEGGSLNKISWRGQLGPEDRVQLVYDLGGYVISSSRPAEECDQVKKLQGILQDMGFSLGEVEDWAEETLPDLVKSIKVVRLSGSRPKDLTPGNEQDKVWLIVFPSVEDAILYRDHSYGYQYYVKGYRFGTNKGENITLGDGLEGIVGAEPWSVYNEFDLPPDNEPYPCGVADGAFVCGNIVVYISHTKAASIKCRDGGVTTEELDQMGLDSLEPVKDLMQKIASAMQKNGACAVCSDS